MVILPYSLREFFLLIVHVGFGQEFKVLVGDALDDWSLSGFNFHGVSSSDSS